MDLSGGWEDHDYQLSDLKSVQGENEAPQL